MSNRRKCNQVQWRRRQSIVKEKIVEKKIRDITITILLLKGSIGQM